MYKIFLALDLSFLAFVASTELLEGWGKLGAIATLSALLCLIMLKTIPTISKDNKEAAQTLSKSIDRLGEKIAETQQQHIELLETILIKKQT